MRLTDIAWLAGIVDGEGCFAVRHNVRGIGYSPAFFIDNSSKSMIDKAAKIIRAMNVEPTTTHASRPGSRNKLSRIPMHRLYVNKGMYRILELIVPYLATEKRAFAKALLRLHRMRSEPRAKWTARHVACAVSIRQRFMPRSKAA